MTTQPPEPPQHPPGRQDTEPSAPQAASSGAPANPDEPNPTPPPPPLTPPGPVESGPPAMPGPGNGPPPPTQIPGYDPNRPIPLPPRAGPPAGSAYAYPGHYAEAPGGQFHLALPQLGTIVSGPAVGSLVAGIGAILVALGIACIGMFQSVLMSIAAILLSLFAIGAAGLLGVVSLRQVRRSEGEYRGKGMALAGLICGGVALLLTVLIGIFVVVLSA